MSGNDDAELAAVRARIDELHRARGYLLPHHGAMATAAPDLQAAYLQMYHALTLTERHLTRFEHETVWMAVLIAAKEAVGTHHVEHFLRAGGTEAQIRHITGLSALALGSRAFGFMDDAWSGIFPSMAGNDAYLEMVDQVIDETLVPRDVMHLALAALHATVRGEWGLAAHIRRIYELGRREDALVEALSVIMWPVGVNHFLDACGVWVDMMQKGTVDPSPRYKIWADIPRQSGHDARNLQADRNRTSTG
ncbi:MAG: hypothetical protein ACK5M4_14925 [Pseudorhodobacter sp.]